MNIERQKVIEKLKNYKGSLTSTKWSVPSTKRQFSYSLNRLLKLYYSVQQRQLFYPELVDNMKQIAQYYKIYINANRPDKRDYLDIIEEILDFEPPLKFTRIEEVREKMKVRCNICRVDLVYPAFLIYITNNMHGQEVEVRSEPIGIFCLHSLHGKLAKFKDSLKIEWQIDSGIQEIEEDGAAALVG